MRINFIFWFTVFITVASAISLPQEASAQVVVKRTCPEEGEYVGGRHFVNNFLTHPVWSPERSETGTTGIDTSQVQVLGGFSDRSACQTLNAKFNDLKGEYNVTYFKAGNRYIATQVIKQPENPNRVASGLSFIYIYDGNLNYIKGYSGY